MVSVREVGYRYDVLRGGVKYAELYTDETPILRADKSAALQASVTGAFLIPAGVNLLTDELRPVISVDGAETGLGIYVFASNKDVWSDTGARARVEAYDRALALQQKKTKTVLHHAAGTAYTALVSNLLTECSLPSLLTPSAAALAAAREWDAGTDYLTIANQYLSEINYDPVRFNAGGFAVIVPHVDPDARNIDRVYDGTAELSILTPDMSRERDWFDAPNVFVCVCDNPDTDAVMTATAINNNPLSGLSVLKRGREIVSVQKVDNIASQEALQVYADTLCKQSMMSTETVTIRTAAEPEAAVGDIVAVNRPELSGIFELVGYTLDMAAGSTMQQELKRILLV